MALWQTSYTGELSLKILRDWSVQDNLVPEVVRSEDLVEDYSYIATHWWS